MKYKKTKLTLLILSLSLPLFSDDIIYRDNFINPYEINTEEVSARPPKILVNSRVILRNNIVFENMSGLKSLGNYIYETEPGKISNILANENILSKNSREFKLVIDSSNQIKVTDGAILIEFFESYDMQNFLQEFDLILHRSFKNINVAEFYPRNFLEIENLINDLQNNPSIKKVNLNVINPNIVPE